MKRSIRSLWGQGGFTLVDLLLLFIIGCVLAMVGGVLYEGIQKNYEAGVVKEADEALRGIRTTLLLFGFEYREFPARSEPVLVSELDLIGIHLEASLSGRYFKPENFTYTGGGDEFLVTVTDSAEGGVVRTIDKWGNLGDER